MTAAPLRPLARAACLSVSLWAAAASGAAAQETPATAPAPAPAPDAIFGPEPEASEAYRDRFAPMPGRTSDYFDDLRALAASLGGAHGVRVACNGEADQYWRRHMQAVLEIEAAQPGYLRTSLVDAFNQSFEAERRTHPVCTDQSSRREASHSRNGKTASERLAAFWFPKPG